MVTFHIHKKGVKYIEHSIIREYFLFLEMMCVEESNSTTSVSSHTFILKLYCSKETREKKRLDM